ncbi:MULTISPECIES: sulfotransferase family 2 domain-containing protein [unclassified Paenibacillus]|uniref:sulfotransferase family 2 domain-containing protein n=1 Tax=unclassified Paenibacillus TaxID=185978 RepID=UPI0007C79388|nr:MULTISPECIES: sulfotransferase family 2 domain-containing protein [unclassified Paenibacillus]
MLHDKITIFMHIPKTGGTTLNKIFGEQFNINEIFDHDTYQGKIMKCGQLNQEVQKQIKAVAGHYLYGIHQYFPKHFQYFTMLRDPVDRVISLYYFLQTYPGFERVRSMMLEEFVMKEAEAYNFQTVMTSGIPHHPDLKKAKEILKTFTVVGTTEMFNETLFLLKKEYGWENIHYTKQNITKKRLSKEEVPAPVINLIKKYNELDLELYDYAKQLLAQKLSSLTAKEKMELQKYKQEQSLLS